MAFGVVAADFAINDNFSAGASYITGERAKDEAGTAATNVDYSLAGVSASAEFGGLYLAATYAQFEGNTGYGYWDLASGFGNGEAMGVGAAYQLDAVRLYTTYAVATTDEAVSTHGTVT